MKRKIFTAILVILAVVGSVAVLEVGARYYVQRVRGLAFVFFRHEYDAYRNHRLRPDYRSGGVRHNSQGFRRDADLAMPKPPGTYRIMLMGASVAYGVGPAYPYPPYRADNQINNDETIDYYLERYFKQNVKGKTVEVVNAGVTGYWTHHHLVYLVQRILKFQPDMVIFLDGHADYYHVNYDQFESYYYSGKRVVDMLNDQSLRAMFHLVLEWLAMRSYFVYAAKTVLNIWYQNEQSEQMDQLPAGADLVAEYRKAARGNFLRMVEYISLILRHEGVKVVFMLQPELILDSKPLTSEERKVLDITLKRRPVDIAKLKPYAVELMLEVTGKHDATFLDLTGIYAGVSGRVYTDYAHLTPLGNRLLAEYVGARIAPLVRASARGT